VALAMLNDELGTTGASKWSVLTDAGQSSIVSLSLKYSVVGRRRPVAGSG
jgi:hypothetical protein